MTLGIPEAKLRVIAPDGRRRLRLEAQRLRRGAARARARAQARPSGASGSRSARENYLATIHGRDVIQEIELAADADGKITAVRTRPDCRHGRVPPARHARHPAARRVAVRAACYGVAGLRLRLHGRLHEHDARPTPTAAPAGPRRPTRSSAPMDALARKLGKDPVEIRRLNFITDVPRDDRVRPDDRLRRLRRRARPGARDRRLRRAARGAGRAPRARRREAARHRLLDLRRDVRARARRGSSPSLRYGAGGWDAATVRCLPTGNGPGGHRHVAARPGPRDDVGADRRRPARRRRRRRRGAARRHGRRPARDGHLRQPQSSPSAASRSTTAARQGDRQGARDRRPPARGGRGRPRVRRRAASRSRAARTAG